MRIMKTCPLFFAGILNLLAAASNSHAQMSRAFPDGVLLPADQGRPVQVAAAGNSAAVLPFPADRVMIHERGGGVWSAAQTISGAASAVAMNSTGTRLAVARAAQIDLYSRSAPGNWLLFGHAYLPDSPAVTKLSFEGDRVVALVQTSGISPGGRLVRVFEYNALDWEMVKEITIENSGPFVPIGGESIVDDFSHDGDLIAVGSDYEGVVRIHRRDHGGSGNWGVVKELTTTSAGVAAIGEQVLLNGNRLAVVTVSGNDRRLDIYRRDLGGPDQWGFAGTLFSAPFSATTRLLPHGDALTGRLAVIEPGFLTMAFQPPAPTRLRIFDAGAGPGDWQLASDQFVGPVRGASLLSPTAAFAGDDLLVGLGPATASGGAAWQASVHRSGTGTWGLQQILSGPGTASRLGTCIAASGKYVAVGMPADSSAGLETGCVMVWYQAKVTGGSLWLPVGRFQATTPAAGARFGASVAVFDGDSEDWLAVGAPGETGGRGAVYLFPLNPIFPAAATLRLLPPGALNPDDGFGGSVAFRPDFTLAVGEPGDDAAGSNAGAAHVFEKNLGGSNNWGHRVKLNRPAGEVRTGFGSHLAFTSEHLVIALPPATPGPGKVFLHSRNTGGTAAWGQTSVLTPPAGSPDGFPASLAADPEFATVVIGATGRAPDDKNGIPEIPGKAFIHLVDLAGTWNPLATLGGTAAEGHGFGGSVATSTISRVVVGNAGFNGLGRAFTYDLTSFSPPTWSLMHTRDGSVPGDGLGLATAALPMFTFSTAPWSDLGGTDGGAVFIDRAGPYELWAASQGPAFTDWHPEADADGDGLANLGEFGLGGNPLSAASRPPLLMTRTTFTNGPTSWPALRWDPPTLPYPAGMLRYQFQNSFNLAQWANTTPDGGLGLGDPPGRFFRIEAAREFFRIDFRYPDAPESSGPILVE